jgi:hypothetical protein
LCSAFIGEEAATSEPTSFDRSIEVASTMATDIEIIGNHVFNVTCDGICSFDNQGPILIRKNVVKHAPNSVSVLPPEKTASYGIEVWAGDSTITGNAQIVDNNVVCNEEPQVGIGILKLVGVEEVGTSSVSRNRITLNGGYIGIVSQGRNNAYIGQNRLEGESFIGILVGVDEEYSQYYGYTNNNTLLGNNFVRLESDVDIAFDEYSSNNLIRGRGTLYDIGTDNMAIGRWELISD